MIVNTMMIMMEAQKAGWQSTLAETDNHIVDIKAAEVNHLRRLDISFKHRY